MKKAFEKWAVTTCWDFYMTLNVTCVALLCILAPFLVFITLGGLAIPILFQVTVFGLLLVGILTVGVAVITIIGFLLMAFCYLSEKAVEWHWDRCDKEHDLQIALNYASK